MSISIGLVAFAPSALPPNTSSVKAYLSWEVFNTNPPYLISEPDVRSLAKTGKAALWINTHWREYLMSSQTHPTPDPLSRGYAYLVKGKQILSFISNGRVYYGLVTAEEDKVNKAYRYYDADRFLEDLRHSFGDDRKEQVKYHEIIVKSKANPWIFNLDLDLNISRESLKSMAKDIPIARFAAKNYPKYIIEKNIAVTPSLVDKLGKYKYILFLPSGKVLTFTKNGYVLPIYAFPRYTGNGKGLVVGRVNLKFFKNADALYKPTPWY